MAVFLKYNLKLSEIEFLSSSLMRKINYLIDSANDKLWGVNELNKSIMDVHNILLK